MMKVPYKIRKTLVIAVSAVAALAIVCTLIYMFAFRTLTIVSDGAFSLVLPKSTMRNLRTSMFFRGIRVRTVYIENSAFDSPQAFSSRLEKVKGRYVLLGPVSASYAKSNDINVSQLLKKSTVFAMYGEKSSLFDCTLVSDEKSGWIKAAEALASEFEKTAQNVALIYENDTIPFIQDIRNCFSEARLSVFEDDGHSKLFASETLKKTDELSIVVAMCPYDSRLNDFFKAPGTMSWVVDYRFANSVAPKQLYGIVVPSLSRAIKSVLKTEKGSSSVVEMEYDYEKL